MRRYNRVVTSINVWSTSEGPFPGPLLVRPGAEVRRVTRTPEGAWELQVRYRSKHVGQSYSWVSVRTSNTLDLPSCLEAPVRPVGRPTDGDHARTRTVAVPMRPDQFSRLVAYSSANGFPVTEMVRRVLEKAGAIPA
jgi:hypothetical protein